MLLFYKQLFLKIRLVIVLKILIRQYYIFIYYYLFYLLVLWNTCWKLLVFWIIENKKIKKIDLELIDVTLKKMCNNKKSQLTPEIKIIWNYNWIIKHLLIRKTSDVYIYICNYINII